MESLYCIFCKKIPNQALKCQCGNNCCHECYLSSQRKCPVCNELNLATPNHVLRQMTLQCQFCPEQIINDDKYIKYHSDRCEGNIQKCSLCSSLLVRNQIPIHLYSEHYFQILKSYAEPSYRMNR